MSNKTAKTKYPVTELIKNRWSPRSFSNKAISSEEINTILEAAGWAFSANNMQPWNYVYAHNGETGFQKLLDCLMPGNQAWAKNASVLISALINTKTPTGAENKIARHDLGAANATLALQAESMGISAHVMGGFDAAKTKETLQLDPENQEPVVFIALGYLDSADKLEEPFKSRELTERNRKALHEFTLHLK